MTVLGKTIRTFDSESNFSSKCLMRTRCNALRLVCRWLTIAPVTRSSFQILRKKNKIYTCSYHSMYINFVWSAIAMTAWVAITSARPQQLSLSLRPPIVQHDFIAPTLQNIGISPSINSIGKPTNPIVVAAFQRDALLPSHMQNSFYKNPKIAESLAQNSWFGPGEEHAVNRDTEKIPREKIYFILKNAGLLPTH